MQQKKLVVGIVEHPVLGLIFIPYIIIVKPNHGFYPIEVKISQHNVSKYFSGFTEKEKLLIKWIGEYSDQNLQKIFSKKKGQTVVEFINSLKKDYADQFIRPYIEKRLVKCTDLIEQMDIDVYYKEKPRYVSVDDRIEVKKGRAQSVFNIRRLENESQYFLSIQHDNKDVNLLNKTYRVICDDPCRIIIDNELYIIDDINAKKLTPFFNKDCIFIPKSSEKKWFETFALDAVKQYNVKPFGFKIIDNNADKKAVLSLEKGLTGNLVLVLLFIYNDTIKFYANKGEISFVRLEMDNGNYIFHKIRRNSKWEEEIIHQIQALGLELHNNSHFHLKATNNPENSDIRFDFIKWISDNKDAIGNIGIELQQNLSELKYCFEIPTISSSVKEGTDWFDIYITVKLGEFEIPFIRFRKNILNGIREYKLPSGEIFILPLEWFEEYKELFQFGKDSANHLQIDKHHFGILENSAFEKNISIFEKYNNLVSGYHKLDYKIPEDLNAELRPYQKEGFGWMTLLQESMFGGCLADDMGLGKTIQTLALLLNSKGKVNGEKFEPVQKPALGQLSIFDSLQQANAPASATSVIVMPTSLIHNWESEIKKFAPGLKCFKYIGQNRTKDISIFNEFDVILTTYGTVRNDFELLREYKFFYIILDESQYIKNPDSKIYKAVNQLRSKHRLVLTGTPIENSLTDLWAQINFLNKGLLGNYNFFKREFVNPIEKNIDPKKKERLQQFIQPFVLRRTKQQVAKDLPDKLETVIYCDMTDEQKSYYEAEKSKIRNSIISSIEEDKEKPAMLAIEGLNKLRQIANHPVMIDDGYAADSGKFEEITRNIENLIAEKHKVLVFSAYVKHLNLFANYLQKNNHSFSLLTGSTQNREKVIADFQESDDKYVFLIQIKAGGVGLNLTAADYVFIIDPWWNPAVEEQAINRTHRIGQDKKVMVYRFISAETVEEKIQQLKAKKSELAESFINTEQAVQKISLERILEFLN